MANEVTVKPRVYGGLKPAGSVGADEFAGHDHSKIWDDGGASDAIARDIKALAADQAKQGAHNYMTEAFGDTTAIRSELCFIVDSSNQHAAFAVFWKLTDTCIRGLAQANEAGDEEYLAAVGKHLQQLGDAFRKYAEPEPEPAPVARIAGRPVRPGQSRPAGASRPAPRPAGAQRGPAPVQGRSRAPRLAEEQSEDLD